MAWALDLRWLPVRKPTNFRIAHLVKLTPLGLIINEFSEKKKKKYFSKAGPIKSMFYTTGNIDVTKRTAGIRRGYNVA